MSNLNLKKARIVEKRDSDSDNDSGSDSGDDQTSKQTVLIDSANNSHGHSHGGVECDGSHGARKSAPQQPQSKLKTAMKFLLLFSMVPVLFSMPVILRSAGEIVANNRALLFYIWSVYAVIWAALTYSKRKLITFSSFVNHNLLWMIMALGTFTVLDIPKMIQQVDLRREVLLVWCTITWIPNIVIFFFDDTDHVTKERLEGEKEKRQEKRDEERKAKLDEKRKKRQKERMSKYTPTQRFLYNSLVYFGLALLVALLAWQTYRWYLKTQQNILDRQRSQHITVEEEVEPNYD